MSLTSFDVFDTALLRLWFRPTDVFLAVGAKLRRSGHFDGTDEAWRLLRIKAEEEQRQSTSGEEVTLGEIFQNLATRLNWSDDQHRQAMAIELEQELASVRPIGVTLAIVKARQVAGQDVVFISDTYFSKDYVIELLRRCGYTVSKSNVYASSESMLTKRTGSLFARVASDYDIPANAISHTGDNRESDYESARRQGIVARYFKEQECNRYESMFFGDSKASLRVRSAFAGCSRAARLQRSLEGTSQAIWNTSANVVGPLLFAYVLWLLLEARERGLHRLYFLARDGQILIGVAQKIVRWLGLPIECRYLYASRQALFLASVDTADDCSVSWLTDILSGGTLRVLLRRGDLVPEDIGDRLTALGFDSTDPDRPLEQGDVSRIVAFFANDETLRTMLLASAARRRAVLLDYLRQEGFAEGIAFGLVDVGWKGRLQYALSRALRTAEDLACGLPLSGFYFGLAVRPPEEAGNLATFSQVDGNINAVLLETFCAADHGTTRGYERVEGGRVEPVLAEKDNDLALDWGLRYQQHAVEMFVDYVTECLDASEIDTVQLATFARRTSLSAFRKFVRDPSQAEAQAFGAFGHMEGQAHADEGQLAPPLHQGELLLWLLRPRRAIHVQTHWPEGSFARSAAGMSLRACLTVWKLRGDAADIKKRVAG